MKQPVATFGLSAVALLTVTHASPQGSQAPVGAPVNVGSVVNSRAFEGGPCISADGLFLYFTSDRAGGEGGGDLWVTRRATRTDRFGTPENIGPVVNGPANDYAPSVAAAGLSLYFDSDRPGGLGGMDLWVARRASAAEEFGAAEHLGPTINSAHNDWGPSITADGRSLYFNSNRPGGQGSEEVWVATRPSASARFGTPQNLGPTVNTSAHDAKPNLSADRATLYFMSDRHGGIGGIDLWQMSALGVPPN
jgi:Tol biopolymer transport system component